MVEGPVLSIIVVTYNHENFIAKTLDGIFKQITSYSFEVIVGDDCSIDNTLSKVTEYYNRYPNELRVLTSPINLGMKDNGIRCILASKGKYIAICDGDDYWIDRYKIDRQIRFLESNPAFALTYSQAKRYFQTEGVFKSVIGSQFIDFDSLLNANIIPTVTVMCRRHLLLEFINILTSNNKLNLFIDYSMWLFLARSHKIHFEYKVTSVYRVLTESASHSKSMASYLRHLNRELEIKLFFSTKTFDVLMEERNKSMLRMCSRYYPKYKILFYKRIRRKSLLDILYILIPLNRFEFILKKL